MRMMARNRHALTADCARVVWVGPTHSFLDLRTQDCDLDDPAVLIRILHVQHERFVLVAGNVPRAERLRQIIIVFDVAAVTLGPPDLAILAGDLNVGRVRRVALLDEHVHAADVRRREKHHLGIRVVQVLFHLAAPLNTSAG
eukprot:TRINITY_DN68126_c2_g1_i1.p1 TRINITY_DN68126_c2_g1~~TRINITY_DN68126_c2_g1_i1.p1  ORF type:complete len:142 (-),score=5.82 TRINITY_DN68126_c2_g1_i1:92-517(-)